MGDEGTDQTTAAGAAHHAQPSRDELLEMGGFALEEAADNLEDDEFKAQDESDEDDDFAMGLDTVQAVRDESDNSYNPLTDPPKQNSGTGTTLVAVSADTPATENANKTSENKDAGAPVAATEEPADTGEKIAVTIGARKANATIATPQKLAAEPVLEELDEAGSVSVGQVVAPAVKVPVKAPAKTPAATAPAKQAQRPGPAGQTTRATPAPAIVPVPKKRRKLKVFLIFMLILLLAAGGAAAYWWYQQPKLKQFSLTSSGVKYSINYFPGAKKVSGDGDNAPAGLLFTQENKGIVAALAPDTNETCTKDKSSKAFDITNSTTGRTAPVYTGTIVDKTYIYVMCLTDQNNKLHLISIMASNSQDDISSHLKEIKAALASVRVE